MRVLAAIVSASRDAWQPRRRRAALAVLAVFALLALGCRPKTNEATLAPEPSGPPPKLKLIVVGDDPLADEIVRQWNAHDRGPLELERLSAEDALQRPRLQGDIIVFPSVMLGSLAERKQIEAWPKLDEEGVSPASDPDIFALQRFRETSWGPRNYAVTFGSPQFVLYIRRDRLADIRREVPQTWEQYAETIGQLAIKENDDQTQYAVAEPLGPGWAARVLLARAAPYVQHRSQFSDVFDYASLEPLIASPPYVRALQELVAAARLAPPEVTQASPVDVKRWFYAGRVAVAWAWPTSTFDVAEEVPQPIELSNIELFELPGSTESFLFERSTWEKKQREETHRVPLLATAGRLGAIVRGTQHRRDAAAALVWLTSREFGVQISTASAGTTAFRTSHATSPRWLDEGMPQTLATSYGDVVATTQGRPRAVSVPRIPGFDRYLAVLDQAVRDAVGGKEPEACLSEAAKQWEEITEEMGRDRQIDAYRRSLGLEP